MVVQPEPHGRTSQVLAAQAKPDMTPTQPSAEAQVELEHEQQQELEQ